MRNTKICWNQNCIADRHCFLACAFPPPPPPFFPLFHTHLQKIKMKYKRHLCISRLRKYFRNTMNSVLHRGWAKELRMASIVTQWSCASRSFEQLRCDYSSLISLTERFSLGFEKSQQLGGRRNFSPNPRYLLYLGIVFARPTRALEENLKSSN